MIWVGVRVIRRSDSPSTFTVISPTRSTLPSVTAELTSQVCAWPPAPVCEHQTNITVRAKSSSASSLCSTQVQRAESWWSSVEMIHNNLFIIIIISLTHRLTQWQTGRLVNWKIKHKQWESERNFSGTWGERELIVHPFSFTLEHTDPEHRERDLMQFIIRIQFHTHGNEHTLTAVSWRRAEMFWLRLIRLMDASWSSLWLWNLRFLPRRLAEK